MNEWILRMEDRQNIKGGSVTNTVKFGEKMFCSECGKEIKKGDWVRLERMGPARNGGTIPSELTGRVFCYDCDSKKTILGTLAQVI